LTIERVSEADLTELLPLMRAYCDFYEVAPSDDDLLALSRALIADPEREGVQLLAREGQAVDAVALAHDATIAAHPQPEGGLRVEVAFPAVRP